MEAHSRAQAELTGTLRDGTSWEGSGWHQHGGRVPVPGGPYCGHFSGTPREGGTPPPTQVPNIPGIRTVSSIQLGLDSGSLLNTAGGDRQGSAEESLTGPTRNVPVTMDTVTGSAVRKRTTLDLGDHGWDLRGRLAGPFWGGSQKRSGSLSWQLQGAPVLFPALGEAVLSATSLCQAAFHPPPPALSLSLAVGSGPYHLPQPASEPLGGPYEAPSTPQRRQDLSCAVPSEWGGFSPPFSKQVEEDRHLLLPSDWELSEHRNYLSITPGSSQAELLSPPSDWWSWKVGTPSLPSD